MTLSPAFLDELRARTTLSTLVGQTTKLTKAGREYKGCCPFHQEKTPSFYVNDDKGFYHCFGCSAHGDAIRWMTDQRGLPFMDAVKELAQAAGMEVPAPDRHSAERAERAKSLHDAMQAAAEWFTQQLGGIDGAAARALLERRGVSDATRRAFGFGYAPDARGKLRAALKEFGDDMLVEAGLLIRVEGKEPYDRFRGRLMIPIRDPRGRVIAFGGRIIGEGEPKYLNSPDTPLFDKGRTLYNLDKAAAAARKADRVIVVEGYMDAIALAQAGIGEAVAPLGTALTEAQLERLWRMHDVPLLCFDGDAAGQKAAIRAAHRALPMLAPGRSLAFVTLPEGQDPDDLVRSGGVDQFERYLVAPTTLSDLFWNVEYGSRELKTPEDRAGLGSRLRDLARTIKNDDVREQYLATFNGLLWDVSHPQNPASSFNRFSKTRPMVHHATDRVVEIGRKGVDQAVIVPALMKGLLLHPSMIGALAEILIRVPIEARRLRQAREVMLDAVLAKPNLESAELATILQKDGLEPVLKAFKRVSVGFSFLSKSSDDTKARKDLAAVADALAAKPQIDEDVRLARAALDRERSDSAFDALKRLLQLKQELDDSFKDAIQADFELA